MNYANMKPGYQAKVGWNETTARETIDKFMARFDEMAENFSHWEWEDISSEDVTDKLKSLNLYDYGHSLKLDAVMICLRHQGLQTNYERLSDSAISFIRNQCMNSSNSDNKTYN